MDFLSPKRISINNIKMTSKKSELNTPVKSPAKEDARLNIPSPESNSKKLMKKTSGESYKQSVMKSQTSQLQQDKSKKIKIMLKQHLQSLVQDIHHSLDEAQISKLQIAYKTLNQAQNFPIYLEQFFKTYRYYHAAFLKNSEQHQLVLPLRYKEAKKILLIEDAPNGQNKSNRNRKIIEMAKQNEDLKKDVFRLKESVKQLEKRLLFLIEEFKQRKTTYLKEIQKLTNIVQTSIKGIPDLIANKQEKTNKAFSTGNQLSTPTQDPKLAKRDSDYNVLFYDYNKQSNIEPTPTRAPEIIFNPASQSTLQRYKSQSKIRTKQ